MEDMAQYTAETALFQKAGFKPDQANLLAVGFTGIHQRLEAMDKRIDQRFDGMETRITAIEEALRSLPWKVIGYTTAVVGALMAVSKGYPH